MFSKMFVYQDKTAVLHGQSANRTWPYGQTRQYYRYSDPVCHNSSFCNNFSILITFDRFLLKMSAHTELFSFNLTDFFLIPLWNCPLKGSCLHHIIDPAINWFCYKLRITFWNIFFSSFLNENFEVDNIRISRLSSIRSQKWYKFFWPVFQNWDSGSREELQEVEMYWWWVKS